MNLKKALDEDTPEKRKQRQQVAKENDWEGKVDEMIGIIKEKAA